jgi:hypothetical protein
MNIIHQSVVYNKKQIDHDQLAMNVKINALSRNKVFVVITQTLEPCTYLPI